MKFKLKTPWEFLSRCYSNNFLFIEMLLLIITMAIVLPIFGISAAIICPFLYFYPVRLLLEFKDHTDLAFLRKPLKICFFGFWIAFSLISHETYLANMRDFEVALSKVESGNLNEGRELLKNVNSVGAPTEAVQNLKSKSNNLIEDIDAASSQESLDEYLLNLPKSQFDELLKGERTIVSTSKKLQTDLNNKALLRAPLIAKKYYANFAEKQKERSIKEKRLAQLQEKKQAYEEWKRSFEDNFGDEPGFSYLNSGYWEVNNYLKEAANDPSSVEIAECKNVRSDDSLGYIVSCTYREKNTHGGLVKREVYFTFKHGKITSGRKLSLQSSY